MRIILLLLSLFAAVASAETRIIYGVPFEVKQITKTNDGKLEVNLGAQTVLVSEENLDRLIVDSYFVEGKRPANFSPTLLRSFIIKAAEVQDIETAEKALLTMLKDSSMPKEMAAQFVEDMSGFPETPMIFKSATAKLTEQPLAQTQFFEMLYYLSTVDPEWFKTDGLRWYAAVPGPAQEYLQRKFLLTLTPEQFSNSTAVLDKVALIFGNTDPFYKKLNRISERLSKVLLGSGKGTDFSLEALFHDPAGIDPALAEALVELVHTRATDYTKLGRSLDALTLLAQIEPRLRTETTARVVQDAIKLLVPPINFNTVSTSIWDLLIQYSTQQPSIKESLIKFLVEQFNALLSAKKYNELDYWFNILLKINPDPSERNGQLRLDWASALIKEKHKEEGLSKLHSVSTGGDIPLMIKKLFLLVQARLARVIFFVIAIIIIITLYGLKVSNKKAKEKKKITPEDFEIPQFVKQTGGKENPYLREYIESLAMLGLEYGASAKQIKANYRKLIKQVHPDRVGETNTQASAKFLGLQKAYDRILELDKEWEFTRR